MTDHKNVYSALAAAQAEMERVVKGSLNPAFKGDHKPKGTPYADLSDVMSAALPALNNHGIALFHIPGRDEHGPVMITILHHGDSDTRIECPVPLIVSKNDMQGYKSATTYAKRIGAESVTGIAPDDDDGNAASRSMIDRDTRAVKSDADRTAAEVRENTNAAAIIDALERCESEAEMIALWTGCNRDERKPLLTRPDVVKAKDAAKARLAQPSPFDGPEA